MSKKLFILFLTVLAFFGVAQAASVKLSVSPQRGKNQIDVGDIFYLTIDVSNVSDAPGRPQNGREADVF